MKKGAVWFYRHAYESVKVHSLSDTNKTLTICFLSFNSDLGLVLQFQAFPMIIPTWDPGMG